MGEARAAEGDFQMGCKDAEGKPLTRSVEGLPTKWNGMCGERFLASGGGERGWRAVSLSGSELGERGWRPGLPPAGTAAAAGWSWQR